MENITAYIHVSGWQFELREVIQMDPEQRLAVSELQTVFPYH